jgi:predicted ferric reductase
MKYIGALAIPIFILGSYLQYTNNDLRVLNKIGVSVILSRGAALATTSILPFILFSTRMKILGKLSYIKNLHRYLANGFIFFSLIHSFSHYINFYLIDQHKIINSTMVSLNYISIPGLTGNVLLVLLVIISIFSSKKNIKTNYLFFFKIHHLYILFLPIYLLHGSMCFVKGVSGICYPYYSGLILIPFILFIFYEKIRRLFINKQFIKKIEIFDSGVRVEIDKTFDYSPGTYAYLNFPDIDSKFTSHPISISSSSSMNTDTIEFSIKEVGIWSSNVKNLISSKQDPTIRIDGPYFSAASKYINYNEVIFICSGIGITPFISIIKDSVIRYLSSSTETQQKMTIYWIVRDRDSVLWFEDIISDIVNSVPCDILDIKIWITEPILDPELINKISSGKIPSYDKILDTNIHFNYNRPNFNKLLLTYKPHSNSVGVFVCGSESMINSVSDSVKKNTKFDLIIENFAF